MKMWKLLEDEDRVEQSFPDWDDPNGCEAIVAVAEDGSYLMLQKPNIFCFDIESDPENNGFGESFDLNPGVYRMVFDYHQYTDWETGYVDDFDFSLGEHELLWELPQGLDDEKSSSTETDLA